MGCGSQPFSFTLKIFNRRDAEAQSRRRGAKYKFFVVLAWGRYCLENRTGELQVFVLPGAIFNCQLTKQWE